LVIWISARETTVQLEIWMNTRPLPEPACEGAGNWNKILGNNEHASENAEFC